MNIVIRIHNKHIVYKWKTALKKNIEKNMEKYVENAHIEAQINYEHVSHLLCTMTTKSGSTNLILITFFHFGNLNKKIGNLTCSLNNSLVD